MNENTLFKKPGQKVFVFDLHNVLDSIPISRHIKNRDDNKLVICCSYVGYKGKTRDDARKQIVDRI